MSENLTIPASGFMRLNQVLKFFPVCKSRWYQGVASGEYPKPIKLGQRVSAWRVEDIRELIARLGQTSEPAGSDSARRGG